MVLGDEEIWERVVGRLDGDCRVGTYILQCWSLLWVDGDVDGDVRGSYIEDGVR